MDRAYLYGIKANAQVFISSKLSQKQAPLPAKPDPMASALTPTTFHYTHSAPVLSDSAKVLLRRIHANRDVDAFFQIRNLSSGESIDVTQENNPEYAAAFAALTEGDTEAAEQFCVQRRRANARLLQAIQDSDLPGVKYLLEHSCPQINAKDESGRTAIHHAASLEKSEVLKYILRSETVLDLNSRDRDMRTPLHLAIIANNVESVALLIELGASVNCVDCEHWTPLHFSISSNSAEITYILLSHNADPTIRNSAGQTPVQLFRSREHADKKMREVLDESLGSVDTFDCSVELTDSDGKRERGESEDWRALARSAHREETGY